MRKLTAFLFISLDGYYKGINEDISWHIHGGDEIKFSEKSLQSRNILLFGRVTYEMMAGFWTTPEAKKTLPVVAEGMNNCEKIVFSNTLTKADWQNSRVVSGDIISEMRKLKSGSGGDMTILGSGTILTRFADAVLLDEFQILIDPVALGKGTPFLAV